MIEVSPIRYENGQFEILDQTQLPGTEAWLTMETREDIWDAIHALKVRGAPAIGVAAAYGMWIAAKNSSADSREAFYEACREHGEYLCSSRPTAVNLSWAVKRMLRLVKTWNPDAEGLAGASWEAQRTALLDRMLQEAVAVQKEDEEACRRMGEYGLRLLSPGMGILTHCNAGALATAKYGTCLAPIHLGQEKGYGFHVFADETRPLLQGARLTCWELMKSGVDTTLICDNMAATVMKKGWIDAVVVGCDRMAANGDGANKIGTSGVAILAKEFDIPFYMYVPTSTIDLDTETGDEIRIECRDGEEIYQMWYEKDMAPAGVKTFNPAFDVTSHENITAVITEKGIVRPPYKENLAAIAAAPARDGE